MEIDRQALLATFAAETEENLQQAEQALVALEQHPGDTEAVQALFRVAHTLKGDAASLGFNSLMRAAHVVEDVLSLLREGALAVDQTLVTLLLEAVDMLQCMVLAAVRGEEVADDGYRPLLEKLAAVARPQQPGAAPHDEEDADPDDEDEAGAHEADAAPEPAAQSAQGAAAAEALVAQPAPANGEGGAANGGDGGPANGARRDPAVRTLRVGLDKLDPMLDLSSEITVARGRMADLLAGDTWDKEAVREAHREAERLHHDLQELVMQVRLVPLGPTFRPFARTVRDLAQTQGKLVRLEIDGEDVEMDTTVVQFLRDPLTHMVRNAVAHGIERPEARRAAGKDPVGRIVLRARHDSGAVVIEVEDDGAGFPRERILAKARATNLVAPGERPDDAQILAMVFAPGFTTAETVTDLSGRGVGMDVVRRNVEALRGSVNIDSRDGQGSVITIRLPLTVAIIAGFSVGVGDGYYVIPLDTVVECLDTEGSGRGRFDGHTVVNLRGEPLPALRLRDLFRSRGEAPGRESVVVVQSGGARAGLVVDALHGESQTVVKPLGKLFDRAPGIAGAALRGDGRVALILDVPALLRRAAAREAGRSAKAAV